MATKRKAVRRRSTKSAAKPRPHTRRALGKRTAPRAKPAVALRTLYPKIEPYRTGHLRVSPVHEIYFEECGNPRGKPALFVHGGPGAGCDPRARRFFDPKAYRIILFDQRGCGRSRPHASLEDNTTWRLVEDIERLREHLDIDQWLVFGGSWGSTLSLAYAQSHPDRVRALVLRGIFLLTQFELQWFYQQGASALFPDWWEQYIRVIPEAERDDLIKAFHKRLLSKDRPTQVEAARAWSIWEAATSYLHVDHENVTNWGEEDFAIALARIECHYFVNRGFFDSDDQLLRGVERIRHIPAAIVQGRYDVVCPMQTAWALHRAWPEAQFEIVPDAGHSGFERGTAHQLVMATDRFR